MLRTKTTWMTAMLLSLTANAAAAEEAACTSRTDGCQVCQRASDGTEGCSLPGIACVKGAWRCNDAAIGDAGALPVPGNTGLPDDLPRSERDEAAVPRPGEAAGP